VTSATLPANLRVSGIEFLVGTTIVRVCTLGDPGGGMRGVAIRVSDRATLSAARVTTSNRKRREDIRGEAQGKA
jgi:hypothetical protein